MRLINLGKISLTNRMIKINRQLIYDAMLEINHNDELITIDKLAKICGCSTRTIHRNIDKQLKKEKEYLNKILHEKI